MAATGNPAAVGVAAAATEISKPKVQSAGQLMILQSIAGAGAGALAKSATAPLERIKIIFQVQVRGTPCVLDRDTLVPLMRYFLPRLPAYTEHVLQGMGKQQNIGAPKKYTGIWQTITLVTREEGPLALWKGNGKYYLCYIY